MAYGLKYELFFQDLAGRNLKLEIHKNDYQGSIYPMVGTDKPVVINWNGDDDIYSPIIGSTCELNLFVTDTVSYDNFYDSDEREYLVKILHEDSLGALQTWDNSEKIYDLADSIYDSELGDVEYFTVIWTGFIVVDRFQESLITTPYPISLKAVDGLGTLSGFDAPFNTENTTGYENLFYYLKEILKLTGHEHNIYISNDIRKVGGSDNDSIFHDIEVDEYALFTNKLTNRDAKDVLKQILEITNSRIYHSYGHWYVVNNSSLIDDRIDQLALAPSGDDTSIEPVVEEVYDVVNQPNIKINGGTNTITGTEGSVIRLWGSNTGSPITSYTWSYGSTTVNGTGNYPTLNIPATSSVDGLLVTLTATNSAGTDTDTATLDVITPVIPDDPQSVGGTIKITVNNYVQDVTITPQTASKTYDAGEVTSPITNEVFTFVAVPDSGYQFDAVGDINYINSSVSYAISNKTLNSDGTITFDVTAPLIDGGKTSSIDVQGTAGQTKYGLLITLDNQISSTSTDGPIQYSSTGLIGESWSYDFFIDSNTGFTFDTISRFSATFVNATDSVRTLTKLSDTRLKVNVSGKYIASAQNVAIRTTGNAINANLATSFGTNISMDSSMSFVYHSTAGVPAWLLIKQNGSGLSYNSLDNIDLFNGKYKLTVTYTSGGSGWLTVKTSPQNNTYTNSINLNRTVSNALSPVEFAGDKFNFIVGPNTPNTGVMNKVALLRFSNLTGGQIHQITVTHKGIYS